MIENDEIPAYFRVQYEKLMSQKGDNLPLFYQCAETERVCNYARNQRKIARLTNNQRNEAIGMLRNFTTDAEAHHFGLHRRTIEILVRKRLAAGTVKDLPRS